VVDQVYFLPQISEIIIRAGRKKPEKRRKEQRPGSGGTTKKGRLINIKKPARIAKEMRERELIPC